MVGAGVPVEQDVELLPELSAMSQRQPILFLTHDDTVEVTDEYMQELHERLPGYHILMAPGKCFSAKLLSTKKMKRREYGELMTAVKKQLRGNGEG